MQEAVLSPLATWQTFYTIIGSAAATLTGLMFVVVTLIAGVRVRVSSPSEAFATFNTPNVVHFGAALLVAAILSAPWQALWNAGLLLGLCGLGGVTYVVIVVRRVRRQTDYQPVLEDWLWHTVLPLVSRRGDCAPGQSGASTVRHRCGDGAAPVHRHPQRVGQRDLHCRRPLPASEQEPGLEAPGLGARGPLSGVGFFMRAHGKGRGSKARRATIKAL